MKINAIIPAGGSGVRMGGEISKQYLEIAGKPILRHTLEALEESNLIHAAILVVPEKDVESIEKEWMPRCAILKKVVSGGAQRQDSVFNGFQAFEEAVDVVLVHDGVRPFVDFRMIQECIEAAQKFGAAITAIPLSDTVKRADDDGFVQTTVDRNGLWRVQTPQAFQYNLFRDAIEKAMADGYYGTDEGSLIEYLGGKIKIVRGSAMNIKITQLEDLALGEWIAASRIDKEG